MDRFKKCSYNEEVSDLYAMNFLSDMTETEYEREGLTKVLPLAEDVILEQNKIERVDCILFLYPVWWSDCPAKLKGWFDRVYSVGYAYKCDEKTLGAKKIKKIQLGIVICTAGHPNSFLDEIGIAQSMKTVIINDRLGKRFLNKEMIILGETVDLEQVRDEHSIQINNIIDLIEKYAS